MAKPKLIKFCLTNEGRHSETPWGHDLGPAPGPNGGRRVRLFNVPFLHAKPTWGDVIVVSPDSDGVLTWDRNGVAWEQLGSRIAEDSGRWAMIVDYAPHPDTKDALRALATACAEHDVVCEGAFAPLDGKPGRAYLAVGDVLSDVTVMARLRDAELPCELIQIHPRPANPMTRAATKRARPTRKVAAKKPAARKNRA
jgi:hypothetical protein